MENPSFQVSFVVKFTSGLFVVLMLILDLRWIYGRD
jgi:hypothetical protein